MEVTSCGFAFARRRESRKKAFLIASVFILVLICLQSVFYFMLCPVAVFSSSMEPCIAKNSAVFILPLGSNRLEFLNTKNVKRGEIIRVQSGEPLQTNFLKKTVAFIVSMLTFRQIQLFCLSEELPAEESLYRLVGLPGDTLYIEDYVARVKESGSTHFLTEFELSVLDYNIQTDTALEYWDISMGAQGKSEPVVLGEDEYFVLCDKRLSAFDSRLFGPIRSRQINGKALFLYYPFSDIKKLY